MKSDYLPVIKSMALIIKSKTHWSLERCFRWCNKHYSEYIDYVKLHILKNGFKQLPYRTQDLVKEFKFRGFVEMDSFKKKKICNYIQSNRTIGGIWWIYPKHYANTHRAMLRGYTRIWKEFSLIAIQGYTRVDMRYQ